MSPRSRRDRRKDVQKSVVSASPRAMFRDLPTPFGRHAGGHHQRPADHPPAHPHVQVRGVHEDVGEPGAVQAAGQELVHALVDVLADPRDRRARDAGLVAQGPHEVVDLAGGDPLDPRGADHGASGPCPPAGGDGAGRGRTTPCEAWGWPVPPRRRWWPPSWASCRCACWCAAGCAHSAPRRSRRRPRTSTRPVRPGLEQTPEDARLARSGSARTSRISVDTADW